MMLPFPYNASSDLPMKEETDGLAGSIDLAQYVNPQYTDKRYSGPRELQSSTVLDGFVTPSSSSSDSRSRRPSLMLSDTAASCQIEPVSASTSSLNSSPGNPWSGSSSDSTTASSRRQSSTYPDSSQCYLSETSPTPAFRPGRPKEYLNVNHYSFSESVPSDEAVYSSSSSFGAAGDITASGTHNEMMSPINDYPEKAQIELQGHDAALGGLPAYDLSGSSTSSTWFSMYPMQNLNGACTSRLDDFSRPDFESNPPSLFRDAFEPQEILPSHCALASSPRILDQSLQYSSLRQQIDPMYASENDDEYQPRIEVKIQRKKQRRQNHKQRGDYDRGDDMNMKNIQCEHCGQKCNRSEHLTRHRNSKHNPKPLEHLCKFEDCFQDKTTKERKKIVERMDNFKAHFWKTHFSYGHSEKSGKNKRKSMKVSIENDLRKFDYRWTSMLAGEMTVDQKTKGFLSAWKMIGYSILETRNLNVKDIAPEWEGPDDTTLEIYDPRWKAIKKGTLTYEQAMSVGADMKETPAQGVLGVTMAETAQMGIKTLDVRWQWLENGKMTVEEAEKLGVKEEWAAVHARRKR